MKVGFIAAIAVFLSIAGCASTRSIPANLAKTDTKDASTLVSSPPSAFIDLLRLPDRQFGDWSVADVTGSKNVIAAQPLKPDAYGERLIERIGALERAGYEILDVDTAEKFIIVRKKHRLP